MRGPARLTPPARPPAATTTPARSCRKNPGASSNAGPTMTIGQQRRPDVVVGTGGFTASPGRRCCTGPGPAVRGSARKLRAAGPHGTELGSRMGRGPGICRCRFVIAAFWPAACALPASLPSRYIWPDPATGQRGRQRSRLASTRLTAPRREGLHIGNQGGWAERCQCVRALHLRFGAYYSALAEPCGLARRGDRKDITDHGVCARSVRRAKRS